MQRSKKAKAPTLGVRCADDSNTQRIVLSAQGAIAALAPASGGPFAAQPSNLVGTPISNCPQKPWGVVGDDLHRARTRFCSTPAAWTRIGGTLPRPPAVLDQRKLPTLLRLKVSPVMQPQRMGSFSLLGGGKGGRPDLVLPLAGLDPHVLCGCTTATAAELHLSPFRLVQSCIGGLGPGEADMLPQTLRHQSPQEGVECQVLPCSRGEFRVAAPGQQLDISSVDPQALLLLAAVRGQQLPALVAEDPLTESPLQCFGQSLKVSPVRLVQVSQHPCCCPLQRQSMVDDRLLGPQLLWHSASRNWTRYGFSVVAREIFGSFTTVLAIRGRWADAKSPVFPVADTGGRCATVRKGIPCGTLNTTVATCWRYSSDLPRNVKIATPTALSARAFRRAQ
ncbi:unnamed protein product [Boreogadus saida]